MNYERDMQDERVRGRTMVTVGMDGKEVVSEVEAIPGMEVCDFCSAPNPTHSFDAQDFDDAQILARTQTTTFTSVGGWAACEACAADVEAYDVERIIDRSMARMVELHPEFATLPRHAMLQARAAVVGMIEGFFAARKEDR